MLSEENSEVQPAAMMSAKSSNRFKRRPQLMEDVYQSMYLNRDDPRPPQLKYSEYSPQSQKYTGKFKRNFQNNIGLSINSNTPQVMKSMIQINERSQETDMSREITPKNRVQILNMNQE